MVKAVRVHEHGGPEVLRYEDIELPPPGAGEVRMRHTAIGLNFIDTYFRSGLYPAPSMPFALGNEGAGTVLSVGPDVSDFKPGDRVAYTTAHGAYAEERNIAASQLIHVPDGVTDEQAAGMMLKGLTAEYLLHRTFVVKPGHVVLVHAAAGATGLILTQWAKRLGATVIGTAGSEEKAETARRAGCDHVILYRTEDFPARVKEITGGALCDVVYDGVGKTTFAGSLDCLKPFGMMASFGSASGLVDAFNLAVLAQKGSLYVTRPTLFTHIRERATLVEMADRLMKAVGSGAITIPVSARFPLAKAADAHRALEGRETSGSTILLP